MLEHAQQVQLEVLTHAAHLGLGQCWGQVGCEDRGGSSVLGKDHCRAYQAQYSAPDMGRALADIFWEVPRLKKMTCSLPTFKLKLKTQNTSTT